MLDQEPDHLLVENVAVDPEWQSQGIGRALLAFAEVVAEETGLSTLYGIGSQAIVAGLIKTGKAVAS